MPNHTTDTDTRKPMSHYDESINGRPATNTEVSYRNGYYNGEARGYAQWRTQESIRQRDVRANNNASRGLLLGIFLTACVGLVVGSAFFLAQRNQSVDDVNVPEIVPVPVGEPAESEPQTNTSETTIIEKTQELVPVPVPQEPATSSSTEAAPEASTTTQPSNPEPAAAEQPQSSGE